MAAVTGRQTSGSRKQPSNVSVLQSSSQDPRLLDRMPNGVKPLAKVCFEGGRHFVPERLKRDSMAGTSTAHPRSQTAAPSGSSRRASISSLRKNSSCQVVNQRCQPFALKLIDYNADAIDSTFTLAPTLRQLEMSNLKLTSIPTILVEALRNIERIDISNNNIGDEGLPESFNKLAHLIEITAHGNKFTKIPGCIRSLKHLQRLKLANNQLVSVEGVEHFRRLQVLVIEHNNLEVLEKNFYTSLRKLEVLDCAYNHIRTLLPDIRTLRHLRYLDISRNDLTSLPAEIFQLPRLEVLQRLVCARLTRPTPQACGNQISRIPSTAATTAKSRAAATNRAASDGHTGRSMTNIDLSENVLVKFPDHLLLLSDVVDLTHNRIKVVSGAATKKLSWNSEQKLLLAGNPLVFPPADVCECGIKAIVQFFIEAKSTVKVYQGIKVMLMGCMNSGKTSLAQTLVDQLPRAVASDDPESGVPQEPHNLQISERTVGIDVYDVTLEADDTLTKPLQLSVWELAGNEDFMFANSLFIQSQPVLTALTFNLYEYSLEYDKTNEDEDEPSPIELHFKRVIGDWMDLIIARNNRLIVIPIATNIDLLPDYSRRKLLVADVLKRMFTHVDNHKAAIQNEFKKFENRPQISTALSEQLKTYLTLLAVEMVIHETVVLVSAKTLEGIADLSSAIKNMATDQASFPNVMRPIPSLWLDIESYVEERGYQLYVPLIRWSDLATEVKNKFGMKHMLHVVVGYLHDTGKVIWFCEHPTLQNYVILRPAWLADILKPLYIGELATSSSGAGFHADDNFKNAGISAAKFKRLANDYQKDMTLLILSQPIILIPPLIKDGIADRDLLRCVWAHLLPSDRNRPLIDTLCLVLEHLEVGYYTSYPSNDASIIAAQKATEPTTSTDHTAYSAYTFVSGSSHIDQNINKRIQIPWLVRNASESQPVKCRQLYDKRSSLAPGNARVCAVYKLPAFTPPGLFERICVRAHKVALGLRKLYRWTNGICCVKHIPVNSNDDGVLIFVKRIHHQDDTSVCIRVEVCHELRLVGDKQLDLLWATLLPFLLDTDNLLSSFKGLRVERYMECPACRALTFHGEWQSPRELQTLGSVSVQTNASAAISGQPNAAQLAASGQATSTGPVMSSGQSNMTACKTCEICKENVSIAYLIQPKQKRSEDFLARKTPRESPLCEEAK